MAYDVIARLSDPTITSKQELITYLIKRAEKKKSNVEFEDPILDFLLEKEKIPYLGTLCIMGPKYSLGCLIGNFIYHYISENNFDKQIVLLKSLSRYLQEFSPSQNVLLKKTVATKLIDTVINFGLPGYYLTALNNRPLSVYLIPYKNAKYNAGYFPYINSIVSYRPKNKKSSPEYIFIHEIGHLLTFNLTGDPGKVPDSFIEFNKEFNPEWIGDLLEVFVDLFSIAVMMDSDFAPKNPFLQTFSIKNQTQIRDYFKDLINDIKGKIVKS